MNKKFTDIAALHGITEELANSILEGLRIEDIEKNPSQFQLEGFESVCNLVKDGTDLPAAINIVEESQKQSEIEIDRETSTKNVSSPSDSQIWESDLDRVIEQKVEKAAEEVLQSLHKIAQNEYECFQETFILRLRKHIAKKISGNNFQRTFAEFVDAKVEENEMGKLKYIESLRTLEDSSPEISALPPEK